MAIPARLETVVEELGVPASEHVVDPGPEQAQGRRALLSCGQVRPPDGPLAAGLGCLPLSQLTCQRGEVTEAGSEFRDGLPLRLSVLAEGVQAPVEPLILVEQLRGEVIEVGFELGDGLPLRLSVLAEGVQAPVKPLILVELARLALAGQPGAGPARRPARRAFRSRQYGGWGALSTSAGRPPIVAISRTGAATSALQGGRSASVTGWSSPAGVICGSVMGWSSSPAASASLSGAPHRAGQDDDVPGPGTAAVPAWLLAKGRQWKGAEPGGCGTGPCPAGQPAWSLPAAQAPGGSSRAVARRRRSGRRGPARDPAGVTGVIAAPAPVCHRPGTPGGTISYRHDNGAWLNAAGDHALAAATPARSPGWTWGRRHAWRWGIRGSEAGSLQQGRHRGRQRPGRDRCLYRAAAA